MLQVRGLGSGLRKRVSKRGRYTRVDRTIGLKRKDITFGSFVRSHSRQELLQCRIGMRSEELLLEDFVVAVCDESVSNLSILPIDICKAGLGVDEVAILSKEAQFGDEFVCSFVSELIPETEVKKSQTAVDR